MFFYPKGIVMKKQYVVQDAWELYQIAVLASSKKKARL